MIGDFIRRYQTFGDFIKALRLRYQAWKQGLPEIPHDGDRRGHGPNLPIGYGTSNPMSFAYRDEVHRYWHELESAEFYRERCERMRNDQDRNGD